MDKDSIIAAIDRKVTEYFVWTIGVTADPDKRRQQHANNKNVSNWKAWPADSEEIARAVEKHFLDLGMKGDTGGGKNPTNVYIF
ncbi:MAG: hypothetical protein OXI27_06130 [Thaumarchaeota archaeon]|nr:hypothetical protein [Nitrososphaerota archaeon]